MPKTKLKSETPKFYEMDGALRAYSNRSIVVAGIMGMVAFISAAGFLFVRMEPPTVIRVDSDGQATVLSPNHGANGRILPSVLKANVVDFGPDEYEKQAFVKNF